MHLDRAFLDLDDSYRSSFPGRAHTYVMVHELGFYNRRPFQPDIVEGDDRTSSRTTTIGPALSIFDISLGQL
jgi:hypothetical protein